MIRTGPPLLQEALRVFFCKKLLGFSDGHCRHQVFNFILSRRGDRLIHTRPIEHDHDQFTRRSPLKFLSLVRLSSASTLSPSISSSTSSDTVTSLAASDGSLEASQFAFLNRFKQCFQSPLSSDNILLALHHPSKHEQNKATFDHFLCLGASTVKFYVYEYLSIKYPKLPLADLNHALSLYTSPSSLDAIVHKYGIPFAVSYRGKSDYRKDEVFRQSLLALLGSIVFEKEAFTIRRFIHDNITCQTFERSKILTTRNYREWLYSLTKRLGLEKPCYRLEGESGRASNAPIFIIGVYSGSYKLGEAYGPSLSVAETRAARNALERYYLEEPAYLPSLPSDLESFDDPSSLKSPFQSPPLHDTPAYPKLSPKLVPPTSFRFSRHHQR